MTNKARLIFIVVLLFLAPAAFADTPVSGILDQYRAARAQWVSVVIGPAQTLFGLLATIEFAWSCAMLTLEKAEFGQWMAAVIRKIVYLGVAYSFLFYGQTWIPAIVDSFVTIGQRATNLSIAPGDVFTRGLNICGVLFHGANEAGILTHMGSAIALIFAAIMCFIAFIAITIQFVCALIESYIIVTAGIIFLGFGGSRWTMSYVERYIGTAVAVGVKIMCLYLLIGLGMGFSNDWVAAATGVPDAAEPAMGAFDIMGACMIYAAVCWNSPKIIAALLGGSPSFAGGDVISSTLTLATTLGVATAAAAKMASVLKQATSMATKPTSTAGPLGGPGSGPSLPGMGTPSPTKGPGPGSGNGTSRNGAPSSNKVAPPAARQNAVSQNGGGATVKPPSAKSSASTDKSGDAPQSSTMTANLALAALDRYAVLAADTAPSVTPPALNLKHPEEESE